ncbi:MAG: CotH kinase family protein [Verrucomicrobiae bacterium]|nr:CotH kinase family protein [Verrucomicrobiae bacterium]
MRWREASVRVGALVGVLLGSAGLGRAVGGAAEVLADPAAAFFEPGRVHAIHLIVSAEDWEAMEPRQGQGGGFGPPGAGRRGFDLSEAFESGRATRPGLAGALGLDFAYVRGSIEVDGERVGEVGLRYKGNGTYVMAQGGDKRPMKVDFNRYVKGQRFRGLKTLNLHNNVVDRTFLHETLGYAVAREAGLPAPRTTYAEVWITVPGRHERAPLGVYTVTEQVDDVFLKGRFGTGKGLLMKPGGRESLRYRGEAWAEYERPLNVKEKGSAADRERMVAFLKLLEEADDATFAREVGRYVDVENTALFLALNVAMVNLDSILTIGQNYYAYLEAESGRLHWWLWDLDNCWGYFALMGTPEQRVAFSIGQPWQGENRLIERLLGVEKIRSRYLADLKRLIEGPMRPDKLRREIETWAAVLRPAIAREGEGMLRAFEASVFGTPSGGSAPMAFGPFQAANLPLVEFVERRVRSVRDQLEGRSEGQRIEFGIPGMGGPRGGRGPGGPGAFQPPPAEVFAMPFLRGAGVEPGEGMTAESFRALGRRWHEAWDGAGTGSVGRDEVVEGLNREFGPPPGAGPGPGGAGPRLRPGPGAGGPTMFGGPGAMWAAGFFTAGDTDRDGRLTGGEMRALFERWAREWDRDGDGTLTAEEIGEGFRGTMPAFPGGEGGPPGGTSPGTR